MPTNKKKAEILGMPYGTAGNRLRSKDSIKTGRAGTDMGIAVLTVQGKRLISQYQEEKRLHFDRTVCDSSPEIPQLFAE